MIDTVVRFQEGQNVEVSTDLGWTPATVTKVIDWSKALEVESAFAYEVNYVPKWEKNGKAYSTLVTGQAVRGVE